MLAVDTYVSHFTRLRLTLCGFLLFVDNGRCADSTYLSSLLGSQFLVYNIYLLAFVDRSHSSSNFFIPYCMLHCYSMSYSIITDRCLSLRLYRWPEYSTRWCMDIWDPKPVSQQLFFLLPIPIHSGPSNNLKAREKKLNKDESSSYPLSSCLCADLTAHGHSRIAYIRIKSSHTYIISWVITIAVWVDSHLNLVSDCRHHVKNRYSRE